MTRGPLIHGALLLAALAFAYQTWTRDDTPVVDRGEFTLWDQAPDSFKALTYKAAKKTVRLERRSEDGRTYLWATVTRETQRPKPAEPATETPNDDTADNGKASTDDKAGAPEAAKPEAAKPEAAKPEAAKPEAAKPEAANDEKPSQDAPAADNKDKTGDDDADDAAASGDSSAPDDAATSEPKPEKPEKPEMITETKIDEFPAGRVGDTLIEAVTPLMALRDLGTPQEKELGIYGLADPKMTVTVEFKNATRSLQIGGRVYGGSDRYVRDTESGRAYVIDGSKLRVLEGGDASLRDNRLIDALLDDVGSATIATGETRRTVVRVSVPASSQGRARAFWADGARPDQEDSTLTNFMSRVEKLLPLDFESDVDASQFVEIATFEYRDRDGTDIDAVTLYRAPGKTEDKPEYYAKSRHTRVFARLNRPLTAQVNEDLAQIAETKE